ncbi:MAG: PAS domain S-box protein, partial [Lacibacter sp.]
MLTTSYSNYQIRELVPEALITLDEQDRFVYVNQYACDMFERKPNELLGKHIWTEFPEAASQPIHEAYIKAIQSKQHIYLEEYSSAHDRWFENHIYQSPGGVSICFSDITERKKRETLLKDHETQHQILFENSIDGVALLDEGGKIYSVNPSACKMFERTAEEMYELGRDGVIDFSDPRAAAFMKERLEKGYAHGEVTGIKKDGTRFPLDIKSNEFTDLRGRKFMNVVVHDNTEINRAKEKISRQHSTLHSLIESISNAIFSLDRNYCYTSFNKAHAVGMKAIYGKEIQPGGCLFDYQTEDDAKAAKQNLDRALAGESFTAESFSGNELHQRLYFEIVHNPVKDNDGNIIGVSVEAKDISQRRYAEEKLTESERQFRLLAENAKDIVFRYEFFPKKGFTYISPSATQITGYSPEEYYADPDLGRKMIYPDDMPVFKLINKGKLDDVKNVSLRVIRKDGKKVWTEQHTTCIYDKEGAIVSLEGIGRDITDRKESEEALLKSEVHLRGILNATKDGILAIDSNGKVITTNKRFAKLWHIPQSLIDQKDDAALLDFVLNQLVDPEAFLSKVQELYHSDKTDFDLLHFKDNRVFERYSTPLILNQQITGRVWSFRDVTEFKLAEKNLIESETLYHSILNASPDDITITDLQGKILMISPSSLLIWGYQHEGEILGRSLSEFVVPEDIGRIFENISLLHQGVNVNPGLYTGLRKDKSSFPVEVNADFIRNSEGEPVKLILSIRDI